MTTVGTHTATTRATLRTKRTLLAVALLAITATALAGCSRQGNSSSRPKETDVQREAYDAFPGTVEVERSWISEKREVGIDGNNLSHRAAARILFRTTGASVERDDVWRWYRDRLSATAAWTDCNGPGAIRPRAICKEVDGRGHRLEMTPIDDEPIGQYHLSYAIEYADE